MPSLSLSLLWDISLSFLPDAEAEAETDADAHVADAEVDADADADGLQRMRMLMWKLMHIVWMLKRMLMFT